MNSLLYLDLDDNLLGGGALSPGRFDNLNTLGTLKLRRNNITTPPWEALGALQVNNYFTTVSLIILLRN